MSFGWKVNKEPKDFINEVYKILYALGLSSNEKVELALYQLKDASQNRYSQ